MSWAWQLKLLKPSGFPTNKGNKMANRFRVEIYDANKLNDITIYSDQGVDKEYLTELVFSNIRSFSGKINAYVFDNVKKKKTTAMFINEDIVNKVNSKTKVITAKELHLA